MSRLRFVVRGRVQGVVFRACTRDTAARLGVTGHVRNRADGAVEGEVQGRDDQVAEFVAWLHHGPSLARVDGVETEPLEEVGMEDAFSVRR